ncbi:tripartite motif-containing protein 16 [Paramormyrops kingsleyae]|uniref:B30.2/SPRY domain-containing protein n=1 Tax=Paramormyrops kingsleyae TaxID=1676925 RepID=A0A3B3SYB7_9TELE|nr:tripartite motif-containing protein 16-like protein [Paramormyrops kingsleyae]
MANTDTDSPAGSAQPQNQSACPDVSSDPRPVPSQQPASKSYHNAHGGKAKSCSPDRVSEDPRPLEAVNIQVNGTGGKTGPDPPRIMGTNNEIEDPELGTSEEVQDQEKGPEEASEQGALMEAGDPEDALSPGEVVCDSCIDSPRRACKSCLTCLVSYCEAHLRPHLENARFQSHRLVEPLQDMEVRTCDIHRWPLGLYCSQDGCCVCQECAEGGHGGHDIMPVRQARHLIEKELEHKRMEMLRSVTAAENAIQKLHSNAASIEASVAEVHGMIRQQFSRLQAVVEKTQKEVTEILEGEAGQAFKQADGIRTHLEHKCKELRKTQAHMDKLSRQSNDIDFLQEYSQWKQESLDFSLPSVYISLADRMTCFSRLVIEATAELSERLPSIYREKLKASDKADKIRIKMMVHALTTLIHVNPKTRNDFLKYCTPLSFDADTVHKFLRLTKENRKVTNTTPWQHDYPDTTQRFEHWRQVLAAESFYLGQHYLEVEVIGDGVHVGLTYKSIDRKGEGTSSCIMGNNFSWCLQCGKRGFSAWHGDAETPLKADGFTRIGIYVDYRRSWLAFFGVADTMTLLHEYRAEFLEPLHAAVWLPKKDDSVMLIGPDDAPSETGSLAPSTPPDATTVATNTNGPSAMQQS